jgi:hypothetical protein
MTIRPFNGKDLGSTSAGAGQRRCRRRRDLVVVSIVQCASVGAPAIHPSCRNLAVELTSSKTRTHRTQAEIPKSHNPTPDEKYQVVGARM